MKSSYRCDTDAVKEKIAFFHFSLKTYALCAKPSLLELDAVNIQNLRIQHELQFATNSVFCFCMTFLHEL